jgi:hypothetical protein
MAANYPRLILAELREFIFDIELHVNVHLYVKLTPAWQTLRKLHDQELGVEIDHQVRQLKNVEGMVDWSVVALPPPHWLRPQALATVELSPSSAIYQR